MKKITLAFLSGVLCLSCAPLFAQSRRVTPEDNINKKANTRPEKAAETPKSSGENPENQIEEDPNIETDDELVEINTEIVTIPVKVTTRSGRFISGLKKEDFQVFEEKAEQEIAFFSDEQQPFTVALVLDMSYSSTFKIEEIQFAAMEFIKQLRESDKVLVVSFDEQVHILSEPTNDRTVLQKAIYSTKVASGTSLYEAVDRVVNRQLGRIKGRKAIVLFTDGVDTTSRRASNMGNIQDILESDVLIYPIQYDTFNDVQAMKNKPVIGGQPPISNPIPSKNPGGLPFPIPTTGIGTPSGQGTTAEDYRKAGEYLNELANRTSGRIYQAQTTVNLAQAFSNIANELRSFYSLGYYPKAELKPGERRKIKVSVKRDGVSVQARSFYVVGEKNK